MKICVTCKVLKALEEFGKLAARPDGRKKACKLCTNIDSRDRKRTKKGLISRIYGNQVSHSKQRNQALPTYSRKDLELWLLSQAKFHVLYDNWVRLDYQIDYVPSVDRKNNHISYTMSNIQLSTFEENKVKQYVEGGRQVYQFELDGRYVRDYATVAMAARETGLNGSHIRHVASGIAYAKSAGGYIWSYEKSEK